MLHAVARQADRRALIETIKRFNEAALAPANAWQPQLPLELAFIDSLPEQPQVTSDWQPPAPRSEQPAPSEPVAARPAAKTQPAAPKPVATAEAAPSTAPAEKPAPPEPEAVDKTAPQPPAEKEESAVGSAAGQSFGMAAVRAHWQELVDRCGRHDRNLPPLLAMCQPLAVEEQTLVLGFQYPILRDKFDQEPHVALVSDVLGELMEQRCLVRAVVTDEYTPPAPPISRDEFEALADELGGVVRDSS
jgi:DNA polymerase-3 subunit gamma/tau